MIQRTASSSVSLVGSSPYISAAMYLTGPTSASNFLLSVSIVYFVSYSLSSNSSEILIFNCNAFMSASVSTSSTTLRSVVIRLINSFDDATCFSKLSRSLEISSLVSSRNSFTINSADARSSSKLFLYALTPDAVFVP